MKKNNALFIPLLFASLVASTAISSNSFNQSVATTHGVVSLNTGDRPGLFHEGRMLKRLNASELAGMVGLSGPHKMGAEDVVVLSISKPGERRVLNEVFSVDAKGGTKRGSFPCTPVGRPEMEGAMLAFICEGTTKGEKIAWVYSSASHAVSGPHPAGVGEEETNAMLAREERKRGAARPSAAAPRSGSSAAILRSADAIGRGGHPACAEWAGNLRSIAVSSVPDIVKTRQADMILGGRVGSFCLR